MTNNLLYKTVRAKLLASLVIAGVKEVVELTALKYKLMSIYIICTYLKGSDNIKVRCGKIHDVIILIS